MSLTSDVSLYDRMCWPEAELERALSLGAHRRELTAFLGLSEYTTLRALAERAERAGRRRTDAMTVYVLPGILGSQLGRLRGPGQPPDLLWLDPADIVKGRLTELKCDSAAPVVPLGAIVYSYLALKLRLAAAGFTTVLHDYDWRQDLRTSAKALAARLAADPAESLALVGHSMGGLLARAALRQSEAGAGGRIRRFIGLGSPHGGSIAAVQALRATYPTVSRLAAIDRVHDAETLTREVFRGFASLYQMLPTGLAPDLFDPAAWPSDGVQPDADLLRSARSFAGELAAADARFVSIIGTGQRTVTDLTLRARQFRYHITAAGDGTVAAACATLPGARNYSLRCEHSELPRSEQVAAALVDLLRQGRTRRLSAGVHARAGRSAHATDAMLRRELGRKRDWAQMSVHQRRAYLNRLSAPPTVYRAPAPASNKKL